MAASKSISIRSKLVKLLHEYRGVESQGGQNPVINQLVNAMYLSEVSTAYYDGKKIIFGIHGWYKEVNFVFMPDMGKIEIADNETGEILVSTKSGSSTAPAAPCGLPPYSRRRDPQRR